MDQTITASNGNGVVSADHGDVPSTLLGIGYDPEQVEWAEEDEELTDAENALAGADDAMPGESSGGVAPAPLERKPAPEPERATAPTGFTGWLKREPIVAALIVANAPILATFVTSISAGNQTLSILAGVAAFVLNAVVGAARTAVTPTVDPKTVQLTPLRPATGANL